MEITDLNGVYMEEGKLRVKILGEDVKWLDAGTFDSLLEASNSIKDIQENTNVNIGCPGEIALKAGFLRRKIYSNGPDASKITAI